MNPERIGKQIAKRLLIEQFTEKVSLYPGAFKPPHKGHVATVLKSIDDQTDRVIIFMSTKERDGVSVEEAQQVWDLYKQNNPELEKVEIVQTPVPVTAVYDYAKDNPTHDIRAVFGKGEEDRFKSLMDKEKYPHVEVFDAGMEGTYSATELRKAIHDNDLKTISEFIPEGINVDDFLSIFQNQAINEIGDLSQAPYKWSYLPDNSDALNKEYSFTTKDSKYTVIFYGNEEGDNWDLEFLASTGIGGSSTRTLTGGNEPFKIMSTVVDIVKDFLKKADTPIKTISYTPTKGKRGEEDAKDNTRAKLYKAVIQRQFPKAKISGEDDVTIDVSAYSGKTENRYLQEARYKKFLNEGWDNSKAKIIGEFVNYCMEYLSVDRPKIKLINSPDYTLEYHSFGGYLPAEQKIIAVVNNRNMADILRTVAHEMVHHMQNLDNRLTPKSGEDGSPDENEANSLAGVIMRKFGRENAHIYEQV